MCALGTSDLLVAFFNSVQRVGVSSRVTLSKIQHQNSEESYTITSIREVGKQKNYDALGTIVAKKMSKKTNYFNQSEH